MEVLGPAGADQEQAERRGHPGEVIEELAGGRIGPLQVLDQDDDNRAPAQVAEESEDRVEEAKPAVGGVMRIDRRPLRLEAGDQPHQLVPESAELSAIRVGAGEMVADRLHEGEEADRQLGLGACPGEHLRAGGFRSRHELGRKPALADSGVAGEKDRPALSLSRAPKTILEQGQLGNAADQYWAEDAFDCQFVREKPAWRAS